MILNDQYNFSEVCYVEERRLQQRGQNVCSQTLILMKQILTFDSVDKVEMCQKRDSHKASTEKNFLFYLLTQDIENCQHNDQFINIMVR